ncbi:hypothetical protein K4K49_001811 [Colletotrichum sp. SAR 10_70]|nr:hypothetical protein K4K50_000675 [Colletotrichum sp. SAR 10_71]KAI8178767.1 hypothetical protein K4K49_001811 [Colletotrichum sp. SAR 10_70]KAI8184628.1 hypothetical protein KHU50_001926 [Colletotrichum sp. SAR 10_65]KAI8186625.1 hypothetical protein K4K51_010301 [Colletotrichum sp. SAR 10_75]KAI8196952.1 hypothetical protein K4K52_010945 [Colletotrichum sp. SAR 10_76]KAI8217600.1 hypothetical protein K4K54_011368 [Colletotrichum sp. SAR 10_86]KAI8248593.1 hypothetical protein K4K53_00068
MKTAFATTIFALTGLATATCHGNNCARAVTGFGPHVKPDISIRIGDCSDFMRATTAAICPFNKVNTFPCEDGKKKGPRCACLKGADNKNQKICVQDRNCKKAKTCKSSDNCEPDEGCVQHHCCDNKKTKICLKYAPKGCYNWANPRAIFEERDELLTEGGKGGSPQGSTAFGLEEAGQSWG